jgi:GH24 family phage-related lysozyme (muramidase)
MIKRSFYKEKIDVPNSDTSTIEKDKRVNIDIVKFLLDIGERSASNYLEKRLSQNSTSKYSDSLNSEYTRNEQEKKKELIKISSINSGILERLDSIERNMIDEQDTSIKPILKPTDSKPALQIIREESKTEERGLSWFDMLLGSLLGVGMLAFLKGFKNLGPVKFALKMIEMGWDFIKEKVIDLATSIAKNIMKPLEEILEFIVERLAKLPGMNGLAEKFGKTKVNTDVPKADAKVTAPEVDKTAAKVNTDVPKADAKVTAGELAKSTEKASAKEVTKISEKAAGKGLLKKIPFLGLGIAGAFAADRISDGDYVGAGGEIASGLLSMIPIIGTAGSIGVDVALMARDIKRANEAVITKLDNEGVIDKGWIGDTTVEKWDEVKKLSEPELKALAEYEDLAKSDREKVQAIIYKKEIEKIKVPETPELFNDGVKIIFNDREILADNLLQSNNKFQEFLINNPFTDENSETTETEINGEKVKQIKFKDDILNQQYLELKEQYDRDFKKYKEARDSQLRNMKDIQEIEGELLTPEQVKSYQSSGMSVKDYSASITRGTAQQDVLSALGEQYKNIKIPSDMYSLADRIKGAEGFRATAYDDAGHKSIGYGHQIKPGEEALLTATLTKEQADALFAKDLEIYSNGASKIPGFADAPKRVQEALVDMTYNMGVGWYKTWPNLQEMMKNKDYIGVKNEILSSAYATQVKGRALINAKIFEQAGNGETGGTDVKLASKDAKTPNKEITNSVPENINKLNKDNAIEQKQAQVQTVENTNKNLVKNTNSASISPVVNNTTNIQGSPKQGESYAMSEVFGSYD